MYLLFSYVQKWFTLNHIHEDCIRKNFENRSNARLRDFLGKARKHNKQPTWLDDEQWRGLQQHWANNSYKQLFKKAQKN